MFERSIDDTERHGIELPGLSISRFRVKAFYDAAIASASAERAAQQAA